jgi:RNA polymerase sigma factor (sigma-70 family)
MAARVADSEWAMETAPRPVRTTAPERLPLRLARLGDERLAQLVGSGRERAFAVLYERYHQPLYRYCRSMLRNDSDAQDVLQSAFALAFAALREGKRNAPLRPWLFRIAHNEAISLLRRRRGGEQELSDSVLPLVASVADQADERARMALLVADLAQLPERQREALVMRELNGLSHADIAAVLGTSVGAAKQAIFDARSALLDLAEGRAMGCEDVRRRMSERDGRALRGRRLRAHLRDCSSCAAFAAAIPERRSDLRALSPLLPACAAAALFRRAVTTSSGHGAAGGAASAGAGPGAGAATAGVVGKLGGAALVSKTVAGAAIVAAAAAGVGGLTKVLRPAAGSVRAVTMHARQAPRAREGPGASPANAASGSDFVARNRSVGRAGSVARSGVDGSAAIAAGPSGHGAVLLGRSSARPGGDGTRSPRAGTGAVSARGTAHGHGAVSGGRSRSSRGPDGTSHRYSAGSQRHGAAPHVGLHATGPSKASSEAGRGMPASNEHSSSGPHPARGSGSAVAQPVPLSPASHSSPNPTTRTTTTMVGTSNAPSHGDHSRTSP